MTLDKTKSNQPLIRTKFNSINTKQVQLDTLDYQIHISDYIGKNADKNISTKS